jgi:hypothetical protein
MLARPLRLFLVASLTLAACSTREAPPPHAAPPAPAQAKTAAPAAPAAPPGHLIRGEVDRVLISQGPPWLLRRAMIEEVIRRDGKFSGWRLVGLPEEWGGIDLKPGDIVSRVNGLPIETPPEAWEAWKSVAQSPELKITLMRDGAARQVVIPIDGAPSAETQKALAGGPGAARAPNVGAPPAAPPPRRSVQLGGGGDNGDDEAY